MIYAHIVFEIRSSKTDKLLQKKENIMKFANEDALNEFSFKQVKKLENNNLQYPGNGKMYVDYLTRTLSAAEVKFCGLPV